jgi:hypothetical protein
MCPIFIPFLCPSYVLDHRLQSGGGKIPKWEPWARMGIYVGCSPSHASNVSMILYPRTGHISLQFHVVYNDDFTMVQYLRTATVPPHWATLVQASGSVELYTEREVQTWQSLPELDVELGDFSSDTLINVSQSTVAKPFEGDEISEGVGNAIHTHNKNLVTNRVTFGDGWDSEIRSMCPDLSLP